MERTRAVLRTLGVGTLINTLLFLAAKGVGLLGAAVTTRSRGQPIVLAAVVVATVSSVLAAIALRALLERVLRTRSRARSVFAVVALTVLVLSFGSPWWGLVGASALDVVVLEVMHVVAAIAAVIAAGWATRPRWAFGAAVYAERRVEPRTAVVTGATSGIGAAVAEALVRRGFRVIGVGRNAAAARAMQERHPSLSVLTGDLGSMRDAKRLAAEINALAGPEGVGVLVHCAGTLKPTSSKSPEGIDQNFATSFLGRFALTESLALADGCRVVNVAAAEAGEVPSWMRSELARPEDIGDGMRSHGQAQLANDIWVAHLARSQTNAIGYGPGSVDSGIRRELPMTAMLLMRPLFAVETRTAAEAAQDIVRLLLDASLPSRGFASRDGLFDHDPFVLDPRRQEQLVRLARTLVERATA